MWTGRLMKGQSFPLVYRDKRSFTVTKMLPTGWAILSVWVSVSEFMLLQIQCLCTCMRMCCLFVQTEKKATGRQNDRHPSALFVSVRQQVFFPLEVHAEKYIRYWFTKVHSQNKFWLQYHVNFHGLILPSTYTDLCCSMSLRLFITCINLNSFTWFNASFC